MSKEKDSKAEALAEEERKWMQSYLLDEKEGFDRIYSRYSNAVYGYLAKRLQSFEERDDLFQKVWLKFHRSRSNWSADYPLIQWLFVISRSVLLDHLRQQGRVPRFENVEYLERLPAGRSNEEIQAEYASELRELEEGFRRQGLSGDQIQVIKMHAFFEEDYEAIARELGKTAVSVRKIFSRGIAKLKASMGASSTDFKDGTKAKEAK